MVLLSPWPSSPARVEPGSLPWASAFTTMSRSVSMPLRRSSSPQIGRGPTSSSASLRAAASSVSFSPPPAVSRLITSRAFLSDITVSFGGLRDRCYPARRAQSLLSRRQLTGARALRAPLVVLGLLVGAPGDRKEVALAYSV